VTLGTARVSRLQPWISTGSRSAQARWSSGPAASCSSRYRRGSNDADGATSAGVLADDAGTVRQLTDEFSAGDALAITIEPAGAMPAAAPDGRPCEMGGSKGFSLMRWSRAPDRFVFRLWLDLAVGTQGLFGGRGGSRCAADGTRQAARNRSKRSRRRREQTLPGTKRVSSSATTLTGVPTPGRGPCGPQAHQYRRQGL